MKSERCKPSGTYANRGWAGRVGKGRREDEDEDKDDFVA